MNSLEEKEAAAVTAGRKRLREDNIDKGESNEERLAEEARQLRRRIFGEKTAYKPTLERPNAQTARLAHQQRPRMDVQAHLMERLRVRFFCGRSGERAVAFPSAEYESAPEWTIPSNENPSVGYLTRLVARAHNKPHRTPVHTLVWDPRGRRICSGSYAGEINLWDGADFSFKKAIVNTSTQDKKKEREDEEAEDREQNGREEEGKEQKDGKDGKEGKEGKEQKIGPHSAVQYAITRLACDTTSGNLLAAGDKRGVVAYFNFCARSTHRFRAHEHDTEVTGLDVSWDGSAVVSGGQDQTVRLWDVASGKQRKQLGILPDPITSTSFMHGELSAPIVVSTRGGMLALFDPRSPSVERVAVHHTISQVAVHPSRPLCLTASLDGAIRLNDFRRLERPCALFRFEHTLTEALGHKKGHAATAKSKTKRMAIGFTTVAWHPTVDTLFVSGSVEGSLAFWLANKSPAAAAAASATLKAYRTTPIRGLESETAFVRPETCALYAHGEAVTAVAWHPLGLTLASGGRDFYLQFWARNRPGDSMCDRYNFWFLPDPTERLRVAQQLLDAEAKLKLKEKEKEKEKEGEKDKNKTSFIPDSADEPAPPAFPLTAHHACRRILTAAHTPIDPSVQLAPLIRSSSMCSAHTLATASLSATD